MKVGDVLNHPTTEVFVNFTFLPLSYVWQGFMLRVYQNKRDALEIYEDLMDYSKNSHEQARFLALLLEYVSLAKSEEEVDNELWFKLCEKWDIDPYVASDVVRERIGGE